MKRNHFHIMLLLLILVFLPGAMLLAQVKIGNDPTRLNADALLELESSNKGLLLPRLALDSTRLSAPLRNFVQGMMVFNTATVHDVTPGIYYCDGSKWTRLNNGATATGTGTNDLNSSNGSNSSPYWSLDGNRNTDPTSDFLGTTDNKALRIRTNNTERMSIGSNGWVGVGTNTPLATMQIKGQVMVDSLTAGNAATDRIVTANPADGRLKTVPAGSFLRGQQKKVYTVATNGQTVFNTPAAITDVNKIMLFRNGIQISFTSTNSTSIISEIPCVIGDEIRIIQIF